jgi:hypothetical protein
MALMMAVMTEAGSTSETSVNFYQANHHCPDNEVSTTEKSVNFYQTTIIALMMATLG